MWCLLCQQSHVRVPCTSFTRHMCGCAGEVVEGAGVEVLTGVRQSQSQQYQQRQWAAAAAGAAACRAHLAGERHSTRRSPALSTLTARLPSLARSCALNRPFPSASRPSIPTSVSLNTSQILISVRRSWVCHLSTPLYRFPPVPLPASSSRSLIFVSFQFFYQLSSSRTSYKLNT